MKKLAVVFCLCAALFSGCGNTQKSAENSADTAKSSSADGIDIDLTKMSSTMVYAEVSGLVFEPEKHIGEVVRMRGESASAVSSLKSIGRPLSSTIVTGLPVAETALSSSVWISGNLMDVRQAASPLQSPDSPSTIITASALQAAATAAPKPVLTSPSSSQPLAYRTRSE